MNSILHNTESNSHYLSSGPRHSEASHVQNDSLVFAKLKSVFMAALLCLIPLIILYPLKFFTPDTMAIIGPIYFILVMGVTIYKVLKVDANMIWTGFVIFPLQSMVFFGIGPLIYSFGNEYSKYLLSIKSLSLSKEELLRANFLSYLAITLVIFGMWSFMHFQKSSRAQGQRSQLQSFSVPFIAIAFLSAGLVLKYLIILPAQWGMIDLRIAGALSQLSILCDLGFAIVAFLMVQKGGARWKVLFWLLWPLHFLACVISVSKLVIVMALLIPLLGAHIARKNLTKLTLGVFVIGLIYLNSQSWVQYGRSIHLAHHDSINPQNYSQGLDVLGRYIFSDDGRRLWVGENDDSQGWWSRLNYSGEQVFAMDLYDTGQKSTGLNLLWMSLIPRAIWPEKPIMSKAGRELYSLISGREGTSSSGVTIYADMYWHYGWVGVWIIAPLVGLLFGFLSILSFGFVNRRDFIYMPIVGLSLNMIARGPTSFVVESIVGPMPIIFVYLFIISFIKSILFSKTRHY